MLFRSGLDKESTLSVKVMPERYFHPAVGQGCVAVQCRDQKDSLRLFKKIEDPSTEICVRMERQLLKELGGGCSLPLGVHSEVECGEFILNGILFHPNLSDFVTISGSTRDLNDTDFIANLIYEITERGKGHILGEDS